MSEEKGLEKVLNTALHVAESTASDADHSLKGVNDDLMEKEKVLTSALHRTQVLTKEEQAARTDLDKTKMAARKAVQAATEAKANAMRNKRKVMMNRIFPYFSKIIMTSNHYKFLMNNYFISGSQKSSLENHNFEKGE